jgi:two-component system response regulator
MILLVDDSSDDQALAMLAFAQCGYGDQVISVGDAVEALTHLLRPDAKRIRPQVVVLDLKLPRLDGLELLRLLRLDERTHHLPVVIFSSSCEAQDLRESYTLGANSYLRKPINFDEWVETARCLAHYWLRINVLPPRHFSQS